MFMFSCHISRINNAIYLNQHQCYCSHRSPNNIKSCFQSYIIACWLMVIFRDGPFDTSIRGGLGRGAAFFPYDKLFFLCFCKTSYFFKSIYCNYFFLIFLKITHSNRKNVNESNPLNENVQKTLNFYFIVSCLLKEHVMQQLLLAKIPMDLSNFIIYI